MRDKLRPPSLSISSTTSSYSSHKGSQCSLSPRLSPRRDGFFFAAPLSPSLPSLVPKHGRRQRPRFCRLKRPICTAFIVICTLLLLSTGLRRKRHFHLASSTTDYEIVADASLPKEPSAVVVADQHGHARWTISIPPHRRFPLRPNEYADICKQVDQIQYELDQQAGRSRTYGYGVQDPRYMDVGEALKHGYLPTELIFDAKEGLVGVREPQYTRRGRPTCEKTMTFVLQGDDAGMGSTLMNLWTAYGLAQKEGREFFIDDSRWAYGNFTDYFKMPPIPECAPAPRSHRVPCPPTAAHTVVSSATIPWVFGHDFNRAFVKHKKAAAKAHRQIFDLMRVGYKALHRLSQDSDEDYIKKQLHTNNMDKAAGGVNIGLHVRRGDRRPWEFAYAFDYLPLERFTHAVQAAAIHAQNRTSAIPTQHVYLASDDPDIYTSSELPASSRAQSRIVLASAATLNAGKSSNWKTDTHGWEGGFFAQQFLNLGIDDKARLAKVLAGKTSPRPNLSRDVDDKSKVARQVLSDGIEHIRRAQPDPRHFDKPLGAGLLMDTPRQAVLSDLALDRVLDDEARATREAALPLRSLVGRAYLMDLAILSQTDRVVCAVSAAGCRILAVMMGWQAAMDEGRWINVEQGQHWKGFDWSA